MMNGRAAIGVFFLALAAVLFLFTPRNVTWGNHHYLKHLAIYGFAGAGALFLLVSARKG
jgi:hypothetical protein